MPSPTKKTEARREARDSKKLKSRQRRLRRAQVRETAAK